MKCEGPRWSVLDSAAEEPPMELRQYRYETLALLRKYLRVSTDLGRLPSALGGEMFRSRVTGYRVASFEDLVIFVIDVAGGLSLLGEPARKFIALHIFQEQPMGEAARQAGCDPRNGLRIYNAALDEMSEVFLRLGVMQPTDWLGDEVASEGWYEGCPVLRRNTWAETDLPPKKPSASEGSCALERVM